MSVTVGLPDRYEARGAIGEGPFSTLVRALDHRTDRPVALKVVRTPAWMREDEARAWRARIAGTLKPLVDFWHPNLVLVRRVGETDGNLWVARDLVDGRPLASLGRVSFDEALGVVRALSQALAALRERGMTHGALHARNVFIDSQGDVRLTDAGVTLAAAGGTLAGRTCRLPGAPPVRSDVSGLATMLYECVVGRPPAVAAGRLVGEDPLPASARYAVARALTCRTAFREPDEFVNALLPASTSMLLRAAWQPAAAAGLLLSLGSAAPLALSQQRDQPRRPPSLRNRPVVTATYVRRTSSSSRLAARLTAGDRIALRVYVRRLGFAALSRPAIADAFALSGAQRAGVAACLAEQHKRTETLVQAAMDGYRTDTTAPTSAMREETASRVLTLLDDDQRSLWEELAAPQNAAK